MFEFFESVQSKVNEAIDTVSDENFFDDVKKFADDGATSVSQFFSDENQVKDDDDDLLGYDLSSDEEEDTVSDMPLIQKQYQRPSKPITIDEEERADSVGERSGVRGGETRPGMPGYASLNAYVDKDEVLKRRITTSRKITEADLDKNDPLYRDQATINNSEKYLEQREGADEDNICSVCLMVPFYRLRHMIMN